LDSHLRLETQVRRIKTQSFSLFFEQWPLCN
jgi:hypothetical protein